MEEPSAEFNLLYWVSLGQIETVQQNVSQTNVNQSDNMCNTAALIAAERNDTKMFELLAVKGANLTTANRLGYTPAFWAKQHKNDTILTLVEAYQAKHSSWVNKFSS